MKPHSSSSSSPPSSSFSPVSTAQQPPHPSTNQSMPLLEGTHAAGSLPRADSALLRSDYSFEGKNIAHPRPPTIPMSSSTSAYASAGLSRLRTSPPLSPPELGAISTQQNLASPLSQETGFTTGFYSAIDHKTSRRDMFRLVANRIIFSSFYRYFYISMTVLAFGTVILSFVQTCPSTIFLVLEGIINVMLAAEVTFRFLATPPRKFFKSKANILDIITSVICILLLVMLLSHAHICRSSEQSVSDLSQARLYRREEALLDSILLMARNVLQIFRIASMLQKNRGRSRQLSANKFDFPTLAKAAAASALADEIEEGDLESAIY